MFDATSQLPLELALCRQRVYDVALNMAEIADSNSAEPIVLFAIGCENYGGRRAHRRRKVANFQKVPTSEGREEDKGEEKPQTVIVDYGGGIIVHQRQSDGTLDEGHEFSDAEPVPDGAIPDEDTRRIKTVDIDTLIAIKDIIVPTKNQNHGQARLLGSSHFTSLNLN